MGKERKRIYRNKGTTPPFPINPEETPRDEKPLILEPDQVSGTAEEEKDSDADE